MADEPKEPPEKENGHGCVHDEDQFHLRHLGHWRLAEKLFELMSDSYSRQLFARHDHVMEEFLHYFQAGFMLRDIHAISNIFATLFDRFTEHEPYLFHAIRILNIFGEHGLKKESVLDELNYIVPTSNFLSLLGYYLMSKDHADVHDLLILTLLASTRKNKESNTTCVEYSEENVVVPVTEAFMNLSFEDSTLIDSLVKIFRQIDKNFVLLIELVIILCRMSKMSVKICHDILLRDGVPVACELMNLVPDRDMSTRVRFWVLELFSTLMDNYPLETASILSTINCIKLIQAAFLETLAMSSGLRMKQLRNDFLLLSCRILQHVQNKVVLSPSFVKELSVLAVTPEVQQNHHLIASVKLEEITEDYEMKQMLFCILKMLGLPEYFQVLDSAKIMECLLSHLYPIDSTNTNPHKATCTIDNKRTLQTLALQVLSYYTPLFLDKFLQQDAILLLLQQIHWCIGKGFLRQKRPVYERDIFLRYCLQILVKVAGTHNTEALNELISLRTAPVMMKILSDTLFLVCDTSYVDYVIKIQSASFIVLATLCDYRGESQIAIGTMGEILLIKYLQKLAKKEHCALPGRNMLLTAIVNCIRCSVVGKCNMECSFNVDKGPGFLLDLLTTAHYAVQSLILACMIDLCSNPEIITSVLAWRGPQNMTFPALLCQLWREEEERLGIVREKSTDVLSRRPSFSVRSYYGSGKFLMGKYQQSIGFEPMTSDKLSASVLDASENFRANIFGLIEQMKDLYEGQNSDDIHPPELVHLGLDDMPTLAIIEGYLDLKGGEVWSELLDELTIEKMNPLSLEQEYIYSVLRMIANRTGIVLGFQRQFRYLQQDHDRIAEGAYYNQYHLWKDEEKIRLKKIHEYLARTSNVSTMQMTKEKTRLEISLEQQKSRIRRLEEKRPARLPRQNYPRH